MGGFLIPPTSSSSPHLNTKLACVKPAKVNDMARLKKHSDWLWPLASSLIIILGLSSLNSWQPATIQTTAGTATVDISSDKSWMFPFSDCPTITWNIEGINALYVDGEGKIGSDTIVFCPQVNLSSVEFEVVDQNDITRNYTFKIHYWLDELLYALSFAGIAYAGIACVYFLLISDITRKPPIGFSVFLLLSLSIGVGIIRNNAVSAPVIDVRQGNTFIYFSANTNQALFPEECIDIRWQIVNADGVTINGIEHPLAGTSQHCQQDGDVTHLRVHGSDKSFEIPLNFLFPHLPNTSWYAVLSIIALIICVLVYSPLLWQIIYGGWQAGYRQDFVVVGSLFLLAMILYIPFGWSHVGHWEEWVIKAYVQGMPNTWLDTELRTRLFVIVPHTLAHILTPNSFIGYNVIHMLMFLGKSIFLYGILRKLNLPLLLAFLVSALFMVYPVNSAIMSLRSFPMQFSTLSLLLAGYLILHIREYPSRLGTIGVWLALLFNVGSNESGYLIILIAPMFWLGLEGRLNWKSIQLTAIWLMMPAVRLAFTFALLASERGFYLSGDLDSMAGTPLERLNLIFRALINSYLETYPTGWAEAVTTLLTPDYLIWSVIGTVIVLLTAWWLIRQDEIILSIRQHIKLIFWGLIFLIPAVGVMISLDFYRNDTWRVFFYAPISGAVVVIGILSLLVTRISSKSIRHGVLLFAIGLIFIPSLSRALNQHDYFVNHAIVKEEFFHAFTTQAPAINPSAQVIVVSDLSFDDLRDVGLFELIRRDMFQSALYLLYDKVTPDYVFVCIMDDLCNASDDGLIVNFPLREIPYDDLIVFHLDTDLTLTLKESLQGLSGFPDSTESYQPMMYIDLDASVPQGVRLLP
jgi:hypothetical protein